MSLPRGLVSLLLALPLLAALPPCPPELALGEPEAPRLERLCPCGCSPVPSGGLAPGQVAALTARIPAPRLPALGYDTPPPAPAWPTRPPVPVDHVPRSA